VRLLCFLVLSFLFVTVSHAERRAFIVGAGDYANITDLKKTVSDAGGYETLFKDDLKFEVTRLTNPSRSQFAGAFGQFLETIQAGDEVVFIFSGHGWSDGAENYLVMTDAPKEASEYVLKSETIPISGQVLQQIKRRKPKLIFAVIDACRDYPFDSLTMNAFQKGLVRTDVSEGMLVLYAAGSGQKALDRLSSQDASPYSVFTRVLLPKLRETDRPLQEISRDVKDEVRSLAESIKHVQRPAYYDELLGSYCLSGTCRSERKSISKPVVGAEPGSLDDWTQWVGDGRVYFEPDSYRLNSEMQAALDEQIVWLEAYPKTLVLVAGHVADEGIAGGVSREYALGLGQRRANSIKDYFVANGISPSRIDTISYGKQRPLDPGSGAQANARNRHAQVMLASTP